MKSKGGIVHNTTPKIITKGNEATILCWLASKGINCNEMDWDLGHEKSIKLSDEVKLTTIIKILK